VAATNPHSKQRFLWQGLAILLPVVVLAVFGFLSLRQDRLMAEAEARQRGDELADSLVLAMREEFDFSNPASHPWLSSAERLAEDARKLTAAAGPAAADPVLRCAESGGPVAALVNEKNELIYPAEFLDVPVPHTPDTSALTSEQIRLWSEVQTAEFVQRDFGQAAEACARLLKANPPKSLSVRILYEAGVAFKQIGRRREALDTFASLLRSESGEVSESGVPLRQLALLQTALLTRPDTEARDSIAAPGTADSAWENLSAQAIVHPNIFSEYFLNEALAQAGERENKSIATWSRVWNSHQTAREAWRSLTGRGVSIPINQTGGGPTFKLTNGWFGSLLVTAGGDHVMLAFPKEEARGRIRELLGKRGGGAWDIGLARTAHFLPSRAGHSIGYVGMESPMLDNSSQQPVTAKIPPYFGVCLDLDNVADAVAKKPAAPASVGTYSLRPLLAERDSPDGRFLVYEGGRPQIVDLPFPLRLEVYLADDAALYTPQRRRAWIFGGLIAACAIAALIGFAAARRAFYRQLRLSEMKSNFVSSVSHELRAPIASVRLMAEGLEQGAFQSPDKQKEYFRFIVQECRRLSSLIENVLDFSRIEQGRKEYELEAADLRAMTEQTVKLMATYAVARQIQIGLRVEGTPSPVELDCKAMQQALVNLIDNAIKHSPQGATITVGLDFPSATRDPQAVRLWVEDQGSGIPAAEHEKIFERFYRIGSELRRETQGAGIGLSIVKHIVEGHGGKVTVRSAPGQGSRFTIELPLGGGKENA
jgi:signal transduction histidine kinase